MDATLVAAALSGAVVALLLTLFGGGGSVLAAPLLLYVVGVRDAHVAIGTSAAAVAVNAAIGLAAQAKAGRIKWPCALTFGAPGLLGSLAGARLAKSVAGGHLLVWFALAMAMVGLSMFRAPGSSGDPEAHIDPAKVARLVPVGAATGLAAGFFGIGGGFLIAPGLMAATGMTLANAAASSLVSVTLFGATTSLSYATAGMVDGRLFLALIVGGAAGVVAGARLAPSLAAKGLLARRLFAAMIVATAIYVLWRALNG
ncbi:MAG: sulfite exporter TauE/SafE family protein [Caulobacter sp.]|nr:sulfite exporter TauE/SafE family protein [Caulobacter sp.]